MDIDIVANVDIAAMLSGILKGIVNYASIIFSITVLIYLLIRIFYDLRNGFRIDPFVWAKPLIIALLLINYTFFFNALNTLFEKEPVKLTQKMYSNLEKSVESAHEKSEIIIINKKQETKVSENMISKGIKKSIVFLMDILKKAVEILLGVFQKVSLSALYVLGPFVIALEMIPGLGGSIRTWVFQVITISLWMPIINIISIVAMALSKTIADGLLPSGESATISTVNGFIFLILSSLISYLSYTRVPSIAGSLFGSGSITGAALGQNALGHAHVASKAVAAKGGRISANILKHAGGTVTKILNMLSASTNKLKR